jgi:RNA polymerase sigma factor (sigma-70 family)
MKNSEQCICEAILSGNETVIRKSYEACKAKVISFLKKKGLGKSGARLAEDFYNDAWTEFLIKVATGKNGFSCADLKLTNFLIGISYNMARNAHRKDCKMSYFDDFEGAEPQYEGPILEIFGQLDRELQLKHAVSQLQPIYQEVIELTYYEKLSDETVAERLGITAVAVRKRRERARKMLQELMRTPYVQQPTTEEFNYYQGIHKALEKNENTEIQGYDPEGVGSARQKTNPDEPATERTKEPRRKYRGPSRTHTPRRGAPKKIFETDQGIRHEDDRTVSARLPKHDGPGSGVIVRLIRKIWNALAAVAASFMLITLMGDAMIMDQPAGSVEIMVCQENTASSGTIHPLPHVLLEDRYKMAIVALGESRIRSLSTCFQMWMFAYGWLIPGQQDEG